MDIRGVQAQARVLGHAQAMGGLAGALVPKDIYRSGLRNAYAAHEYKSIARAAKQVERRGGFGDEIRT